MFAQLTFIAALIVSRELWLAACLFSLKLNNPATYEITCRRRRDAI